MRRSTFLRAATAIAAVAACGVHAADDTPIKLEVGFAAGGPTDVLARLFGNEMAADLKTPVVVENLTGASGNLATMAVARAAPDGHTLLLASLTHNVNPLLMPETSRYDPLKDFTTVSQAVTLFQALIVPFDSPINSVAELLAKARAPGGVTYGSAGIGGSGHLGAAALAYRSHSEMVHIPFRGNAPALAEVMAGRVDFMFFPMIGLAPMVASKKIRVLAVTTAERRADYPDVPTMAEAGFPGFEKYSNYVGFLAPKGTPLAVRKRLYESIKAAIAKPAVLAQLRTLGAVEVGSTPEEFQAFLVEDKKRWGDLIKGANIKAE